MERLDRLTEVVDAFWQGVGDLVLHGIQQSNKGSGPVVELHAPFLEDVDFFLGFLDGSSCTGDGHFLDGVAGFGAGEVGAVEFLLGLFEFFDALFHLPGPVGGAVGIEPTAHASDFAGDVSEGSAGFLKIADEVRAEGHECIDGCDLCLVGHGSALVEIMLDALGLAEEVWGVAFGDFEEGLEGLDELGELGGEFFLFLILPGISEGGEASHERAGAFAEVAIEAFEFGGKAADFLGVDDGL